jgi:hypothetical protein
VSTPLAARALAGLHRAALRGAVHLAMLPLRAAGALLLWLGLVRVTATVVFLGWAEPIVGLRPAGWLAVIWWVHRLTRHKRAELYRHELVRRAEHALERQVRALAAATRTPWVQPTPTSVPATPSQPALPPVPVPTATDRSRGTTAPQPAATQAPEQTVAAVGRYAAGWVAQHRTHATTDTQPRRRWWQRR